MELGLNQRASLEQAQLFPRKIQESEKRKEPVRSSPDCLFPIYHGSVLVRGGTLSSPISNVKRTGTPPGVRKEVNPRYTWDLPPSRPPVRLIYRLCRARSERSSVVSLCLSSALHTISKADWAGQNPFASVSVCEEGEGWRAAAAAAWQPWYSLKGLVPRGNATDRGPRASWLLFTPRQQARVWQGESLEIGQDDRGASPSPPALPLLPAFAFA